jgi:hypothetical protein
MKTFLARLFVVSMAMSALAGCAASDPAQVVSGKVLTQAFVAVFDDGDPCEPAADVFTSFPGSQVTLKDSSGKILGVTNIELNDKAANPSRSGTQEGSDCAYYFTFEDVVVEDKFFTVEFGLSQLTPATVTSEELTNGLVLNY